MRLSPQNSPNPSSATSAITWQKDNETNSPRAAAGSTLQKKVADLFGVFDQAGVAAPTNPASGAQSGRRPPSTCGRRSGRRMLAPVHGRTAESENSNEFNARVGAQFGSPKGERYSNFRSLKTR